MNIRKLADRAKKVREVVDQQGGPDALKAKANKMRDAAKGEGSMGDRAKAAAAVAREKPGATAEGSGDEANTPMGGGNAPPEVAADVHPQTPEKLPEASPPADEKPSDKPDPAAP